jgi:hypothetical protein
LQAAQAIGQHDLRKQVPHGAADRRAIDAFGNILLGWNAETVGDHVDVGGRVAHFDAGYRLLRRMLVASIIDLSKPFNAFILPHTIEKIMSGFSGAPPEQSGPHAFYGIGSNMARQRRVAVLADNLT